MLGNPALRASISSGLQRLRCRRIANLSLNDFRCQTFQTTVSLQIAPYLNLTPYQNFERFGLADSSRRGYSSSCFSQRGSRRRCEAGGFSRIPCRSCSAESILSSSSTVSQSDLEHLASLCQQLEAKDALQNNRPPAQVDQAAEVRALRLLLEEADMKLSELEGLVVGRRGRPLSTTLHAYLGPDSVQQAWSSGSVLPALRQECGMTRRQVAEAVLKFPDLLSAFDNDVSTTIRRLRWHLCTDWATKEELEGEGSLAALLVREPALLLVERDAMKTKIHELLRQVVNPQLPLPEDIIGGTGPLDWDLHYSAWLQPALRAYPQVLVGKGVKNLRRRIAWLAEALELGARDRASPEAVRLLVLAAGLDIQALQSRGKMLGVTTGLETPAELRSFLLASPQVLLVPGQATEAAARTLAGRCPDRQRAQQLMRHLLRQCGEDVVEQAASISV